MSGRLLVVAPSWIGDCVCTQPLLARLIEREPGLQIDVFAPAWVAPVFERMPQVREILHNPFGHGKFDFAGRRRRGRELAGRYARAMVLPNSWKSALLPFFARVPERTGFVGEARYGLLTRCHKLDEQATPQLAERYAQLAEAPGARPPLPLPALGFTRDAGAEAATLAALDLPAGGGQVVFCPGAEYGEAKRWPPIYFAELAQKFARPGAPVLLLGSAKDAPVGAEIEQVAAGAARNLCGSTNLAQALDLIATARLAVSNDSGLMHVAAAFGTPLVALYGSSSPNYTPPLSARARVLWTHPECSPCFKRTCPLGHFRCMIDLSPTIVGRAAEELLHADAAGTASLIPIHDPQPT
ncbi:MAG: lipopolysaccharide heptosyltransferase II [Rhodocyclaceae bacterium]|nr:lipopolysaccharide heptosyltransferase II [Rhodocyclaceae bacterium]MBX3671289.1 lipopolysaccharide heptosyltransferase II [Rhodocyclaceae bacterium]